MMSLGHVLFSNTQLIRMRRQQVPLWQILLILLTLHIPLDIIPHIEPGLLSGKAEGNYMVFGTWAFWWALIDLGLAAVCTCYLSWKMPDMRIALIIAFVVVIAPDLASVWIRKGMFGSEHLLWYTYFHTAILHWWKGTWPTSWAVAVGVVYVLAVWIWSGRVLWQYTRSETESETSPAQIKPEFSLD